MWLMHLLSCLPTNTSSSSSNKYLFNECLRRAGLCSSTYEYSNDQKQTQTLDYRGLTFQQRETESGSDKKCIVIDSTVNSAEKKKVNKGIETQKEA